MQMRAYLNLRGLTLEQLRDKLREAAPGEFDDLALSTIGRHAGGQVFPSPKFQDLYAEITEGAVRPQDWVDLARGEAAPARASK